MFVNTGFDPTENVLFWEAGIWHHLIIVVFVDRAFETGQELLWDSGIESLLHLLTDRGFEPGKRTAINCSNRI